MQKIQINETRLAGADIISHDEGALLRFPAHGGGISLPELKTCNERYLTFYIEVREQHSQSFDLSVTARGQNETEKPRFYVRFGVLPNIPTLISIDLDWLNADQTFPDHVEGALKFVCLGGRVEKHEIDCVTLVNTPSHHDLSIHISEITLTDEKAGAYPLPDIKLIDELGQLKTKEWPQKVSDVAEMKRRLQSHVAESKNEYGSPDWSKYGGWTKKKLTEGSGFFSKIKLDGKWWLVDPLGYAFFSMGPDVIAIGGECRVDGWEKYMDWLPAKDDPEYKNMYDIHQYPPFNNGEYRERTVFSFMQANLYRALGEDWHEKWMQLMGATLKQNGMNTIGNWSDGRLSGACGLPYVTTLHRFPTTDNFIFRDLPDVFSEQYRENAYESAKCLAGIKDDPYAIGYFLRNEPLWAFADGIHLADEVLRNPAPSACRDKMIETLKEKYGTVDALSTAWNYAFTEFDDLRQSIPKASALSDAANDDIRAFSRRIIDAYISIPAKACREVAPNHMNLGMRWAWITNPDLIAGWENFDVFSINCYETTPTQSLQNVVDLGVDLPIVIGEFQFGALDAGQTATGLEAAASQEDRGKAYRYYCDQVAAHTHGVGCHWFQCYDQFALGRTDGENYNIGLFDICSQPNEILLKAMKDCGENIYAVAAREVAPTSERARHIPKIAF